MGELTRKELLHWVSVLDRHEAQEVERARSAGRLPVFDYAENPPPVPAHIIEAIRQARDPALRQKNDQAIRDLEKRIATQKALLKMLTSKGSQDPAERVQAQIRLLENEVALLRMKVFLSP